MTGSVGKNRGVGAPAKGFSGVPVLFPDLLKIRGSFAIDPVFVNDGTVQTDDQDGGTTNTIRLSCLPKLGAGLWLVDGNDNNWTTGNNWSKGGNYNDNYPGQNSNSAVVTIDDTSPRASVVQNGSLAYLQSLFLGDGHNLDMANLVVVLNALRMEGEVDLTGDSELQAAEDAGYLLINSETEDTVVILDDADPGLEVFAIYEAS